MNVDFIFPLHLLDFYEHIQFRDEGSNKMIYDAVRKKWMAFRYEIEKKELDPIIGVKAVKKITVFQYEELVRQLLIQYLLREKAYPISKISLEGGIKTKNSKGRGRYDLFVFDPNMDPFLIVECKGPEVQLTPETFSQVHGYDYQLKALFVGVANGKEAICYQKSSITEKPEHLNSFPDYPSS